MFMSDVMTSNIFTVPSSTSLAEARRIMEAHHIRRLPVVDRGMLVGVVSRDGLDRAGPSQMTSLNIHEITRLLNKLTVKEVMSKDLVTVSPDATVEEAVTAKKVLGVVKDIVISNELLPDAFGRDLRLADIILKEGEYPVPLVKVLGTVAGDE